MEEEALLAEEVERSDSTGVATKLSLALVASVASSSSSSPWTLLGTEGRGLAQLNALKEAIGM
jgi:hypothetical protein